MKKIFLFLWVLAGTVYLSGAQQLESDEQTAKQLVKFQLFVDSVEKLMQVHKLSFDTVYQGRMVYSIGYDSIQKQHTAHGNRNKMVYDTFTFEPSPNRNFFARATEGGYAFSGAIEAQYYFIQLPQIACLVESMTLDERKEYVDTINRFTGFLEH